MHSTSERLRKRSNRRDRHELDSDEEDIIQGKRIHFDSMNRHHSNKPFFDEFEDDGFGIHH